MPTTLYNSGTTGLLSSDPSEQTAITLSVQVGRLWWLTIENEGTNIVQFSLDGGTTWAVLIGGAVFNSPVPMSIETVKLKRLGANDFSGVYVFAWPAMPRLSANQA